MALSCGIGHRLSSNLALLWLWYRPVAPIRPLAWEPPLDPIPGNLTSEAQVTAEVRVRSLAQCSGLKDLLLLQLWHRSELRLGFSPWPGNLHMPRLRPFKENYLKI